MGKQLLQRPSGLRKKSILSNSRWFISLLLLIALFGPFGGKALAAAAPTLSSVIPGNGTTIGSGNSITLTGTNFVATPTVSFGGVNSPIVTYVSATTVLATLPAHAVGLVNVILTNPDAQSSTLASGFTYIAPPTATGISPGAGPTSGGTNITVSGTNFMATPASGGTITTSGAYTIHTFTSSGTFIVPYDRSVQVLVIGGGGGGGAGRGGGGGAGGYQYNPSLAVAAGSYPVTVGSGGPGAATGATATGSSGSSSTFSTITASGGGGGGSRSVVNGVAGASGGGGGSGSGGTAGGGGGGTAGQGNNGGSALNYNSTYPGGGGGGSSSTGSNGTTTQGGNGGNGTANSISGLSLTYAGGGGGGARNAPGGTGMGGGGTGGYEAIGADATPNTGGGGGAGGTYFNGSTEPLNGGGTGGTGIVVIKYLTVSPGATPSITFGGVAATNFNFSSSTSLTATAPAHAAGLVNVVVTNLDGQTSTPLSYSYAAPPTITSAVPNSELISGGDSITLNGANFVTGATVSFGGSPATVVNVSPNSIIVTAPAHPSGPVTITVTNPDGQSFTLNNNFTYTLPPPTVTGISPTSGPISGNNSVTITGTNFASVTAAVPTFASHFDYTTGTGPFQVITGDFNKDGNLDLATGTTSSSSALSVLLGTGTGTFGAKTDYVSGTTANAAPYALTTGDFNKDGNPDLAAVNANENTVSVLLGNGTSVNTFSGTKTNFAVGTTPEGITTGDFNKDGNPDLAVTNVSGNTVTVLLGNGTGTTFTTQPAIATGINPRGVITGDFNKDGNPDLAFVNANSSSVSVILGNGTSVNTFGATRTDYTIGAGSYMLTTGDFNKDGNPDLAAVSNTNGNVSVILGNGTSVNTFGATRTDYPTGAGAQSVAVGDFNNDSSPDLAVVNNGAATVSVLLGNGSSINTFGGTKVDSTTTTGPRSVAIGDFNKDGAPDMAVASLSTSQVSAILNITPRTPVSVAFGGLQATNVALVNPTTITVTPPAHAAGPVSVVVTNGDGQAAPPFSSYTYNPPPTITSAIPNTEFISGGDTITLNGTNFVTGATVSFGGSPATGVNVTSPNGLIATAPAHPNGLVGITVTNPDGQSFTLNNNFTYTLPPPFITGISPTSGGTAGGTAVTVTGTGFQPKNTGGDTGWAAVPGKTLPTVLAGSSQAIIGNTIYLFGGLNGATAVNTIFSAPVSDPTSWTNVTATSGKTLPGTLGQSSLAVIGGYIYLFGGSTGTGTPVSVIYRAPTTDPTTWSSAGNLLVAEYGAQVAVVGSNVYLYGGVNSGGAYLNNIYYTATVNPATGWANASKALPGAMYAPQLVFSGTKMYLYGGYNGSAYSKVIYYANTADPITWYDTGQFLPAIGGLLQSVVIGDYIYLYGGFNNSSGSNAIYRATVADPTTWTTQAGTLYNNLFLSSLSVIDGYVYLFGGDTSYPASTSAIYRAPVQEFRPNLYNPSWITDWATATDLTNLTIGGVAATNINVVSPTTITATAPAHVAGGVAVTVTNSDGASNTSSNIYTYVPPPTISSALPVSGSTSGNDSVTITGSNFTSMPTVSFGGVNSTGVTYVNSTTLIATTPAHPSGSATITVTNPNGASSSLPNGFTYLNNPVGLTSVSANTGVAAGGAIVTINGTNFHNVYTKPLTVTNSSGAALTNYQLLMTLDTSTPITQGKMRSDCGDLRIYDNNQVTQLAYWIESGCNTTTTKVWVEVANLPTGTDTLYETYGNSGLTSLSNGSNVFDFFDDFSTQDATKWDWPAGWSASGGLALNTANYVALNSLGNINASIGTTVGEAIDSYMENTNSGSADIQLNPVIGGVTYNSPDITTSAQYYSFFAHGCQGSGSCPTATTTSWHKYESTIFANQQKLTIDGALIDTQTTALTQPLTKIFFYFKGSGSIDYVYLRKYVATAPTVSTGSETTTAPSITFGGVAATGVSVISATQMQAVTPAHALGPVAVTIADAYSTTASLNNAFSYVIVPYITSITPNVGYTSGSDTVTISGSNFTNGATVNFGSVSSPGVIFQDSSTLIVTTPANSLGQVNVTVTNPDGQFYTKPSAFTYILPAPSLSSVSPPTGPVSGQTNLTITGSNLLIPKNSGGDSSWATLSPGKVLPGYLSGSSEAIIGSTIYLFGGYLGGSTTTGAIYSASVSDPTSWTSAGALPVPLAQSSLAVIGGYIYLFGGATGTGTPSSVIYRASTATPTSWTSVGNISVADFGSQIAVVGSNIYLYGGYSGSYLSTIYTATTATPTSWTTAGSLPGTMYGGTLVTVGSSMYLYGGYNGSTYTKVIYTATTAAPATWTDTGKFIPAIGGLMQSAVIGNNIYLYGGWDNSSVKKAIYVASISDPVNGWTTSGSTLPAPEWLSNMAIIDGYIYMFGGYTNTPSNTTTTNIIYRAPLQHYRPNINNLPWQTNWTTSATDLPPTAVTIGGLPATNVQVVSPTTITATTPAHAAGPVTITVTDPDGQIANLSNQFTYNPAPGSFTVSPNSVTNAGGDIVTISGSNFMGTPGTSFGGSVSFGGFAATKVTYQDSSTLIVTTPAQSTGQYDVTVTNPDGQSTTKTNGISFVGPPPTVTAITPNGGPTGGNTNVTISGTNFLPAATGGTITTSGAYTIHTFTSSGTFSAPAGRTVEVLVAGGGGGGGTSGAGDNRGGGGGAGGLVYQAAVSLTAGSRPVVVGNGGASTQNGGNSSFNGLVAVGGGAGGSAGSNGSVGGSGGGGGAISTAGNFGGGAGTAGQGFAGGTGGTDQSTYRNGGGGGGAGAVGFNAGATASGGVGLSYSISGNPQYYAGGGAGGGSPGVGGLGGGGATNGGNGTANTGGGGGGGAPNSGASGTGGSGIVIIKYLTPVPTVTFDGVPATNVHSVNTSTITATTPAHPGVGTVDVTVSEVGSAPGTLPKGFTYLPDKLVLINPPLSQRETQPGTLTLQMQDNLGNVLIPSSDFTINLSSSQTTGFFARNLTEDPSTEWNYNSVVFPTGQSSVTFYYKDNQKGSPIITAALAAPFASTKVTQTESVLSKYRFLVTGVTNPVKGGVPSSVTIQAVDYNGQPLHDYTGTVHFSSTDGGAQLPTDFAMTSDLLGGNTFVNGVTMVTQGTWCVTATDTVDPNITGSQCTISVTAPNNGQVSKLAFITPPKVFLATDPTEVISVQAQDDGGESAAVLADKPIYIYTDSPTGQFSTDRQNWVNSNITLTIHRYTSTANFYYRDPTLGGHLLTARDDQGTGPDFGWVNDTQTETTATGSIFKVALSTPASMTAGAINTLHVSLQDALGNDVPTISNQNLWALDNSFVGAFSTVSDLSSNTSHRLPFTVLAGQTGIDLYYRDTASGARAITISDGFPPNGPTGLLDDTETVTLDPAPASTINFTTPTQQVVAGTLSATTSIQLTDGFNNPSNATSSTVVYLSGSQPGVQFFATDGTTPITSVTIPAGQNSASFKFIQTSFVAQQTIIASDSSPPDGNTGLVDTSQIETIDSGTATKLTLSGLPASATAGDINGPLIISLKNQYGVTVPASTNTTLYLHSTSSGGSFSLTSSPWTPIFSTVLALGSSSVDLYYQDTAAGSSSVSIADQLGGSDTGLGDALGSINISAGAVAKIHIITPTQTIQAQQISAPITARLEDQYGNPSAVTSQTTIYIDSGPGPTGTTGVRLGSSPDNMNGGLLQIVLPVGGQSVTFYYQYGGPAITTIFAEYLTQGPSSVDTQVDNVIWGDPTKIEVEGGLSPLPSITAGVSDALTIALLNAYGSYIPAGNSQTASLNSSNGTGRFDTAYNGTFNGSINSVTFTPGQIFATFYYLDTRAGASKITVNIGGLTVDINQTIIANSPVRLAITSLPQTLQTGQRSDPITVTLYDNYANVATANGDISIVLSSDSLGKQFMDSAGTPTNGIIIPNGATSGTFYYSDTVVGGPTLKVGGPLFSTPAQMGTLTEAIIYGSPTGLSINTVNNSLTAGQASAPITVSPINAYGQVVPATSNLDVALNSVGDGSTGGFDTNPAGSFNLAQITIPNGSTLATFYYRAYQKGSPTVYVTHSGFDRVGYSFNVSSAAPARLDFMNAPTATTAGATSATLIVAVEDAYGNLVSVASDLAISVSDSDSNARLGANPNGSFSSGPLALTIYTGAQTTGFYYRDTLTGLKDLTASSAGLISKTQHATINPATFDHLGFTTPDQSIVVQNPSTAITFTGYDQYGNQRSIAHGTVGGALIVKLTSGSPSSSFSTTSSLWNAITQISVPYDAASATFYYKDNQVVSTTITAQDFGHLYPAITLNIAVRAGSVSKLYFINPPAQIVVKNTPSQAINLTLADQYNNPSTAGNDVSVHLASNSSSGEFSPDGTSGWASSLDLTYTPGTSLQSFYYRDSSTGSFSINATSSGLTSDAQGITIIPGTISQLAITPNLSQIIAGQSVPVRVQTQTSDGLNAAVANDTSINLTPGGSGSFSLSNTTWTPITSVTIPVGQYQMQLYYKDTLVGTDQLIAHAPSGSDWTNGQFSLIIGAAAYTSLGLNGSPLSLPAGTPSGAIVVQAQDQYGNAVEPNFDQTLYLYGPASGQFSVDGNSPWNVTSITMLAGTGVATFYYTDPLPGGNKSVTVSDKTPLDSPDTDIKNAVVHITIAGLPPTQLKINGTMQTAIAGRKSGAITIEADQANGQPAILGSSLSISLSSNSTGGAFYNQNNAQVSFITIPLGSSSVTVYYSSSKSSPLSTNFTLKASSGGLTDGQQDIKINADSPTKLTFMTPSQTKTAGVDSDQIRLQLQDQFGNAAISPGDLDIALTPGSPSGSFSLNPGASWSPITDSVIQSGSSDLYFYYHDTTSGASSLGASILASPIKSTSLAYTVNTANAVKLHITTLPIQNLVAGQVSGTLSVSLLDTFGNAVKPASNFKVYLSSTSTGGSFSATSSFATTISQINILAGSTAANFYYKDTVAGGPIVKVSDLAPPDSPDLGLIDDTQIEAITAGAPDHLKLIGTTTAVAGQPMPITVYLKNIYGIDTPALSNLTIYLHDNSSGGQFATDTSFASPITSIVIPSGASHIDLYYKDTVAGASKITAADQASGSDIGLIDDSLDLTITPASLTQLRFITNAPHLQAGQPSDQLSVQAQDIFGNAVQTLTPLSVYLSSSSASATFSATAGFGSTLTQVSIPAGQQVVSFYYKDLTIGLPKITASDQPPPDLPDQGLTNGTQNADISAGAITQIVWSNLPSGLVAGQNSDPITIQTENAYNVPTSVAGDTTIYLTHTGASSGFSQSSGGPWSLNSVTIPAGQNNVQVYYRSTAAIVSDQIKAADNSPANPDTGYINAVATLGVTAGVPVSLNITSSPTITISAQHTSPAINIETRNSYGVPAPVLTDTLIYLRSDSGGGEFAAGTNGPWGINYVTLPAGQSNINFYYHDSNLGTPTISIGDNLPLIPDTGMSNTSQQLTVVKQAVDHLLVTNISTPQVQGSPSSVVIEALDDQGYIVSDYAGSVNFTSSDSDAFLPSGAYAFNPGVDKGIHTFGNAVAFLHPGTKSVTATDTNGISGVQTNIIVSPNGAGPINALQFTGTSTPFNLNKSATSGAITVQTVDSNGQPSNALAGGYPVHLTSSSAGGQFALSPGGPWSSVITATIPAGLNSTNIYYRDSTLGTATLSAVDWIGGTDNPAITNASLAVSIRSLVLNIATSLQVNNNDHYYEPASLLFAKDSNGDLYAQADFAITVTDETTGQPDPANLTLTWRDIDGNVVATQTANNVSSYSYHIQPIQGLITKAGNYTLEVDALDPAGNITGSKTVNVALSGWNIKVDYDPNNKVLGQSLPYTITTKYNNVLMDAPNFSVIFRDNNGNDVSDYAAYHFSQTMSQLTHTGTGQYSGSISSAGLLATDAEFDNAYFLYAKVYQGVQPAQTLAEDNHFDIFFQNNPALAPKNFQIEKIQTSTPPTPETYNLKFSWDNSQYATSYTLYRTQNKNATLYTDPCTIYQVQQGHRYGDTNSRIPFCETQIQQNVGTDDTTQWVQMAQINEPGNTVTIPWSQLQSDQPGSVYYYLVRAENTIGESSYSTMAFSVKKHFTTNAPPLTSINWSSLPYYIGNVTNGSGTAQHVTKASDIVKDIEGSIVGSSGKEVDQKIDRVAAWDVASQRAGVSFFYNAGQHKWIGTDFSINPGDSVYLQASQTGGFDWTVVGSDVTASFNLQANTNGLTNFNWLSIPFTGKYITASDIVNDIEGSLVGSAGNDKDRYIDRVATWNVASQRAGTSFFYNAGQHKWIGTDFTINPGDGTYIQLSGGQLSLDWAPPLIINPYN